MSSDTKSFDVPLDLDYAELEEQGQLALGVPGDQRPIPSLANPMGLPVQPCECCGAAESVGVCPKSITCPHCGASAGRRCRRPSDHLAAQLHAERVEKAERLSAEMVPPC